MTNIIEPNEDIKVGEKIETISPETIQVPDYSYGIAQNTIDGPIGIRNLSGGGAKLYCGSSSKSAGTGTQSITGVGFKPKMVLITAIIATTPGGASWGQSDGISQYCSYTYQDSNKNNIRSYNSIIINAETNIYTARATLSSLDNDGFTLNWTQMNQGCNYQYQCYG